MTQRIAVYGGSFDPFHTGHLVPTVRAQETSKFDAVHFVPAGNPPHKRGEPLTPITHRLSMVALATLPFENFYASDDEVFINGPTYTVDTVKRYRERFPRAVLYFLLGSDSFSQIATWERWNELVDLAHLVVLHRAHIWGSELRHRVPEKLRAVFLLSEGEGLSYAEIGQALGCSPGTVASRKHHAVKQLRRLMEEQGFAL